MINLPTIKAFDLSNFFSIADIITAWLAGTQKLRIIRQFQQVLGPGEFGCTQLNEFEGFERLNSGNPAP